MIPEHIKTIFAAFSVAYPNWELFKRSGPELSKAMETWASLLADCDHERLVHAAVTHARTCKFAPTVAELRATCIPPRARQIGAEEAWVRVMGEIRRVGYMGTPKFSDPKIMRAVEAVGGWRNLSTQLTTDVPMNRAHFLRCFAAYASGSEVEREHDATTKLLQHAAANIGGGGDLKRLYGPRYVDPLPDPVDEDRAAHFARLRDDNPDAMPDEEKEEDDA